MIATINDLMGERALATRRSGAKFAGLGRLGETDSSLVTLPASFYGFDNWAEPPLYADASRAVPGSFSYGSPPPVESSSSPIDWNAAIQSVTKLIQTGQQAYAQQRIIDLNMERARAGLTPLDPRNFSPSAAVNFGLTPQAQQTLLYGALALGAVLLLSRRKKK